MFDNKFFLKIPVLVFDSLSIVLAWYLAFALRFNIDLFPHGLRKPESCVALMILCLIQVGSFYYFKVYRGLWRFSSLNDVHRIVKSVLSTMILVVPIFYFASLLDYIPRSILPLYCLILITLLCSGRFLMRYFSDKQHDPHDHNEVAQRVLIVGAGQAGEGLIRDLNRTRAFIPVGLVDDDFRSRGLDVHGVSLLGNVEELPYLVAQHRIDLIFIAIPSATSLQMRRIVNQCMLSKVPYRTLPSLHALASGRVEVNALRKVNLDDLLGRDQVRLEWDKITECIAQKKVLVTGAGGSIGSELCRQIMALNPAELLLLDHSEYNLYRIEQELQKKYPQNILKKALLCVTDEIGIGSVFQTFRPDIVFHAAAYKHVPLLEDQARVVVKNNVLGTRVVALASVDAAVSQFILISTDKAVNPTNIMGTTKRVAEIYCQNLNMRVKTNFITVRFGNVLGSVGSVVPLFQEQLEHGGPLTVTHPDIERYFMTISEACQLILQAMANGLGGEILVLDMGEPIKIGYLAEQMIRLAGKTLGKDIHIEYTGLRPGEKLFEELFHASEQLTQTKHEKLLQASTRQIDWNELALSFERLNQACHDADDGKIIEELKKLVPEFTSTAKNNQEMNHAMVSDVFVPVGAGMACECPI